MGHGKPRGFAGWREALPAGKGVWAEIRQGLGDATQEARAGLVALFLNVDEKSVIKESAQTLGAFYHALMIGVIAQRLMDPGQAPSARDLAEALQKLTVQMRPREKRRPTKQRPAVKDR